MGSYGWGHNMRCEYSYPAYLFFDDEPESMAYDCSYPTCSPAYNRVVVKIKVPFWVPYILGAVI